MSSLYLVKNVKKKVIFLPFIFFVLEIFWKGNEMINVVSNVFDWNGCEMCFFFQLKETTILKKKTSYVQVSFYKQTCNHQHACN